MAKKQIRWTYRYQERDYPYNDRVIAGYDDGTYIHYSMTHNDEKCQPFPNEIERVTLSSHKPPLDFVRYEIPDGHRFSLAERHYVDEKVAKELSEESTKIITDQIKNDIIKENMNTEIENTQVGGNHYANKKLEPIDYIQANDLGFCEGNIVKYITRYEDKNKDEDVIKVIHYAMFILNNKYGRKMKLIETKADGTDSTIVKVK